MKIKEMENEQKPREKALQYGLESLSDLELIALLLQSGNRNRSVFDLAQDVLNYSHGLSNLYSMHVNTLMEISGIKEVKALQLLASIELSKRVLRNQTYKRQILTPEDVVEWFELEYGTKAQEYFVALYLNTKAMIITHKILSIGTLNESCVHPRDLFKEAYLQNAHSILCVHNHPSGDVTPSRSDSICTRQLYEVSKVMGIQFMDHIIVGKNRYYSFAQHQNIFCE